MNSTISKRDKANLELYPKRVLVPHCIKTSIQILGFISVDLQSFPAQVVSSQTAVASTMSVREVSFTPFKDQKSVSRAGSR